jgi:hypothetical protein
VPRTPDIGLPFASDQSHLDEVITGGFYSIGAEVLVEQEAANYFKAATVLQMCCGEVRVEYLSGKKEWVDPGTSALGSTFKDPGAG